jgi:ADP-dependent NAD(P)H-hydrate dehydratase / NAD(P)H-hydrate epimerase
MKVATAREMKEIDSRTIQEYGISSLVLMERAGFAVACRIRELFGRRKVIVISGNGSNGGDGLVVARHLHNEGWDVNVFLASASHTLSSDALVQYKAAGKFGVPVHLIEDLFRHHQTILRGHALIIDAVLGTGLSKPVTGMLSDIVGVINEAGIPVLSVDIPTGISSDNGQILGNAVRASCTVTFGLPKRGHLLYPGAAYTGKLFIEDIGFPRALITSGDLPVEYLEKSSVSGLVPLRNAYSHKGHYGHVLVIAGSRGKTGAARMAAKACLRSGAGLVTVGVPESLAGVFQSCFTEEMTLVLPDKGNGTLSSKASREILDFIQKRAQVLSIGPGIGVSNDSEKILHAVIRESLCPVIIDADGINSLRGDRKILKHAKAPIILTPHPGEMKNLLHDPDVGSSEIEKDRVHTAVSFAKETSAYLVLKGVPTVVADPDGRVFINSTGNPGMATAGSGDVLTGMISGFLGQTREPLHASILGVYLHGLAGDIAASLKGQNSIIATDLIDEIPSALHSLTSQE